MHAEMTYMLEKCHLFIARLNRKEKSDPLLWTIQFFLKL